MKPLAKIFLLSFIAGAVVSCKDTEPIPVGKPLQPGTLSVPTDVPSTSASSWMRAQRVTITDKTGTPIADWTLGGEGPGLWLYNREKTAMVQMGVHANGFPFFLISDYAIRNFGLGRVDGANASAILVFRNNDVVKLVFGLSMTEAGQPPFLAHWAADGVKRLLFGTYCDSPGRACTN